MIRNVIFGIGTDFQGPYYANQPQWPWPASPWQASPHVSVHGTSSPSRIQPWAGAGATLGASLQRCLSRVCAWLCMLLICSLMQRPTSDCLLDLPCHHRLVWWSWSALLRLMVAVGWSPSQSKPPALLPMLDNRILISLGCSQLSLLPERGFEGWLICFTALVK